MLLASTSGTEMPMSTPPSGGPTNWFITISTAYSRPFALGRSSLSTIEGRIDWAAVSNSVSPTPSANEATYRIGSDRPSPTASTVRTARVATRKTWTLRMVNRRSSRSASAPATSTNTSHGRRPAIARPAMRIGESVSRTASNGIAMKNRPSARFEAACDPQRRQKLAGRPCIGRSLAQVIENCQPLWLNGPDEALAPEPPTGHQGRGTRPGAPVAPTDPAAVPRRGTHQPRAGDPLAQAAGDRPLPRPYAGEDWLPDGRRGATGSTRGTRDPVSRHAQVVDARLRARGHRPRGTGRRI